MSIKKKKLTTAFKPTSSKTMQREFFPKTDNQSNYIDTIHKNEITICTGPPGSGKSFCSVGLACEYLCNGNVDEIIFTRPIIGCGNGIAALPGEIWGKIQPYFIQILDILEFFLGRAQYKSLMQLQAIKFIPLEIMRGMSIKNTFLVLDESNNADMTQLKMLVSRLDKGSKFVLNGDYKQSDLRRCDFEIFVNKLYGLNIKGLGFCELSENDIQRPRLINSIMKGLE